MKTATVLQRHIDIIETTKPILVVFKGFPQSFFLTIQDNKLLDAPLTLSIQELDSRKAALIPQLFLNKVSNQYYWCTFEEYTVVGEELLKLYYTVLTFANNLFDHTYPALYSLSDDVRTLQSLSEDEPERDDNGDEQVGLLFRFYGSVRKINDQWFVTFIDVAENEIPFYEERRIVTEKTTNESEAIHIELSENEDDFLTLELDVIEGRFPRGAIYVAVTGDLQATPHRYSTRLEVLQALFEPDYTFYYVHKQTKPIELLDDSPYVSVLKRYWGYPAFRTLRMYKNVQNRTKETIQISQAQIVHDIVQEALKAKADKDYRDIFVTSPTGAGKSVMFQVPAIYLAEQHNLMTIVISPLIGLMNDQVQGLHAHDVSMSATINSEISPVEKMEIRNKIQERKISILYISPETLLSRSDIAQLIGDRQVGLIVIDEAHIVTTWGKAFRSDYWYLGTYLAKLRKEKNFPIATFTATAIYGGMEDMYVETRDSLNLISPISYFGYVRRDDLEINIMRKQDYEKKKFSEYLMDKNKILINRLERFVQAGEKTLVYFPTVRAILDFKEFVRVYGSETINANISIYYGPLGKEAKKENYLRFKKNDALIMLATKAFGMGIDIPDIQNVYHFAPTGNVCDYVQEIGRAARALDEGYAYFDFLPQDFVHVQRLHGISTIKKGQLVQVIRKILSIMDEHKGKNIRNILVSADEFRYIFQEGNDNQDADFDNKIKTALLIIEKDFQSKLTYSPIVARPRSIFANEYFLVPQDAEEIIFPRYSKYFMKQNSFNNGERSRTVYRVDLKGIWQDLYPSMSFPEFKYQYHSGENRVKLPFHALISPVLQIQLYLKDVNAATFKNQMQQWTDRINVILGRYAKSKEYFNVSDLAEKLRELIGGSKYSAEMIASILLDSCFTFDRLMRQSSNFYNRFIAYDESREKYHLLGSGYAGFTDWLLQETNTMLQQQLSRKVNDQEYEIYFPKVFGSEQEKRFIYLGLMEALGLLMYRVNGGDNPEIFIRVNSRMQLERTVANPSRYRNLILENVHNRHKLSVEMLRYIFENQVDTKKFWDLIEDYFLGKVPEEILQRLGS